MLCSFESLTINVLKPGDVFIARPKALNLDFYRYIYNFEFFTPECNRNANVLNIVSECKVFEVNEHIFLFPLFKITQNSRPNMRMLKERQIYYKEIKSKAQFNICISGNRIFFWYHISIWLSACNSSIISLVCVCFQCIYKNVIQSLLSKSRYFMLL